MDELTLDPKDWDKMKSLAHRMVDDMMTCLQDIRSQPNIRSTKEAINGILSPLTQDGEGEEKVYEIFLKYILPYSLANVKPRFWGYVVGTGSPYGMLAEMLTSGVNSFAETVFVGGYVHQQVIDWIKEMLDYPAEAGGVLVSGGSEANFTGLAVARNAKAEVNMKKKGVQGLDRKMTLYCSEETHHCLERSVELLGLGSDALRWLPTDTDCRIKIESLKKAIIDDKKQNNYPFCIIGNAGTVNSGAFDDFKAIANLCLKNKLWFHVDGAFGSWVKISKSHRNLAEGIERADSLAVDLHKWMYMPYGIGCALVKDKLAHYSTFVYGHEAEYLKTGMQLADETIVNPHNLALPLSRSFTSLKAYMLLRAYGKEKYSQLIQQNIDQIKYLSELIQKDPHLEITVPVASNIVCFQYKPKKFTESELEKLNRKILDELWQTRLGIISDTTIKGKFMLRACCVNHRSQRQDFDFLVNEIKKAGEKYASQNLSE
ncbi:MAG: pyridoxal phosphate-dependent decarboxylase family protein [Promethearchaeota archaeon]